ncbi:MAG TPA: hypothetical protein VLI90_05855, partial [Tepidisphaeraceae bacterium]|nr:hypothetical protein [Tepidisphaeraceae bacterium]
MVLGLALWAWVQEGDAQRNTPWPLLAVASALLLWQPFRRALTSSSRWLTQRTSARRGITTIVVATVAGIYLFATARLQQRPFVPIYHDEFMYLLQARLLASGRLWMPQHPLADFFDTFYVLGRPVYAPLAWPGISLFYVPGIWLAVPPWVTSLLLAACTTGLVYRLVAQLMGDGFGLLAPALVLSLDLLRTYSILAFAHIGLLMLMIIAALALMAWTRRGEIFWALCFGAAAGWACITRPVDALCFLAPMLVALLWQRPVARHGWRVAVRCAIAASVAALPFLALQLIFDRGVTGHSLKTPYALYCERDLPGVTFGFPKPDPHAMPASIVPQKQYLYSDWIVQLVRDHQPDRFISDWIHNRVPVALRMVTPHPLLLIALPF